MLLCPCHHWSCWSAHITFGIFYSVWMISDVFISVANYVFYQNVSIFKIIYQINSPDVKMSCYFFVLNQREANACGSFVEMIFCISRGFTTACLLSVNNHRFTAGTSLPHGLVQPGWGRSVCGVRDLIPKPEWARETNITCAGRNLK